MNFRFTDRTFLAANFFHHNPNREFLSKFLFLFLFSEHNGIQSSRSNSPIFIISMYCYASSNDSYNNKKHRRLYKTEASYLRSKTDIEFKPPHGRKIYSRQNTEPSLAEDINQSRKRPLKNSQSRFARGLFAELKKKKEQSGCSSSRSVFKRCRQFITP